MVDVVEQTADIEFQNPVKFPATLARYLNLLATGANPEGPLVSNWEICIERPKIALILSVCTLLLSGCSDSNNTRSVEQHTADATAAAIEL